MNKKDIKEFLVALYSIISFKKINEPDILIDISKLDPIEKRILGHDMSK